MKRLVSFLFIFSMLLSTGCTPATPKEEVGTGKQSIQFTPNTELRFLAKGDDSSFEDCCLPKATAAGCEPDIPRITKCSFAVADSIAIVQYQHPQRTRECKDGVYLKLKSHYQDDLKVLYHLAGERLDSIQTVASDPINRTYNGVRGDYALVGLVRGLDDKLFVAQNVFLTEKGAYKPSYITSADDFSQLKVAVDLPTKVSDLEKVFSSIMNDKRGSCASTDDVRRAVLQQYYREEEGVGQACNKTPDNKDIYLPGDSRYNWEGGRSGR